MRAVLILFICMIVSSMLCPQENGLSPDRKRRIEHKVELLKKWPLAKAKKAAQYLVRKGDVSIPFLLVAIKNGEPGQRAGASYCMGKLKAARAFDDIEEAAHDRKMRSYLRTLFAALVQIDEQRAYPVLLDFLQASTHTGSYPAFRILGGITREEHLSALIPLLKANRVETRRFAVQLIAQVKSDRVLPALINALSDVSPKVANEVAGILGEQDDPKIREQLLSLVSHHDKRLRGYAIIALVMQEDRFKKNLFDGDWIPVLLSALRSDDYFIRGTAAVALVNVGFYSEEPEIISLMDKNLAPILIETVASKVYFKDYVSLRKIAYQKLEQLSGQDFGHEIGEWWKWWDRNKKSFQAVRLLKGMSLADMKQMRLKYQSDGMPDACKMLLIASPEKAKGVASFGDLVILNDRQLAHLANTLKKANFFELDIRYGNDKIPISHTITLEIPRQVKKVVIYGHDIAPIAVVIDEIKALARENRWQMYWDNYNYPDWLDWYQEQEMWFANTGDPVLKKRRIKRMILSSYGWLSPEQRNRAAFDFFELMEQDHWLSSASIELALFHIQSEQGILKRCEFLIQGTALSKDPLAINPLVRFLLRHYSLKTRKLLKFVLENAKGPLVLQYLKHPDGHLRGVSAEILGEHEPQETTTLYLITMLEDNSAEVCQCAVEALGKLKAKIAWEGIHKIAMDHERSFELRHTALLALAKISQKKAMPILFECLAGGDTKMRGAIALCMGEIGNKTAVQTLLALFRDPSPKVRQIACNSLVKIKGRRVVNSIITAATQQGKPEIRLLAIRALTRMRPPEAVVALARLLEDENHEVRSAAALALAELYDKRAVPVMIAELGNSKYGFVLRRQLEKLTLISFPERDYLVVKECYLDWWKKHGQFSPRQWLFDALRSRNYPVTSLLDYLMGGENEEMIPVLIQALDDRDWYIRAAACRVLEESAGKSFGLIEPYTGYQTTRKISHRWQKWYRDSRANRKLQPGKKPKKRQN